VDLPRGGAWRNVLSGEQVQVDERRPGVELARAFAVMPWAVLTRDLPIG
jgi:hypothetical protein